MDFGGLGKKAKEAVASLGDAANSALQDFNEALPTLRALGFTVHGLHVGMGIPPNVGATLVASTDTIDVKKIKELIDKYPDKKVLVLALKALEAAYNVKQEITDLPLKGIEVEIGLIPPKATVHFQQNAKVG